MKRKALLEYSTSKPEIYTRSSQAFWDDPHIAEMMLRAHLDPTTDAASRPPAFIENSVNWLSTILPEQAKVVDLGCGPGLYTSRLADRGYRTTGIDLSENSLRYARTIDSKTNYLHQNYLELDLSSDYEAALLIWCDYGALSLSERLLLMQNVYETLQAGGQFILDVYTPMYYKKLIEFSRESIHPEGGFWTSKPYTLIENQYLYKNHTSLHHYKIKTDSTKRDYYIWNTCFTKESILREASTVGFSLKGVFADVCGTPMYSDSETICVVLQK